MRHHQKYGFTLIEVLLVVVVMLLLAGFLFRIARMVADRANVARAKADLQMIANAIEEFYSEYGYYPPVPYRAGRESMMYQYVLEIPHPDWPERIHAAPLLDNYASLRPDGSEVGYHYGLAAFLLPREVSPGAQQYIQYVRDSPRDELVKRRWAHYLAGVGRGGGESYYEDYMQGQIVWRQSVDFSDPWRNAYRYRTEPPFLSYRLWSAGPDGADGTADDIEVSSP